MIDVFISRYQGVEWIDEKKGEFSVAVVFGNIPLILLNRTPTYAHGWLVRHIETVLEHEVLGYCLERIEEGSHHKFDQIFPYVDDMRFLSEGSFSQKESSRGG